MAVTRTSDGLPQRKAHLKPKVKQQILIGSPKARHLGAKPLEFQSEFKYHGRIDVFHKMITVSLKNGGNTDFRRSSTSGGPLEAHD